MSQQLLFFASEQAVILVNLTDAEVSCINLRKLKQINKQKKEPQLLQTICFTYENEN